jgi:hypothetical protein
VFICFYAELWGVQESFKICTNFAQMFLGLFLLQSVGGGLWWFWRVNGLAIALSS